MNWHLRRGFLALLLFVAVPALMVSAAQLVLPAVPKLFVVVDSNKPLYVSNEKATLDVFVALGEFAVPARLESAIVTITRPDGFVSSRNILFDFFQVRPGHFRAHGVVTGPGLREVQVTASYQVNLGQAPLVGFGFESFLVDVRPYAPPFFVSIEFKGPPPITVCDEIKITLANSRTAYVRFLQLMPNGYFQDILVPGWLHPGQRWIKFKPGKFQPGKIVFKVMGKDKYGNIAENFLEFYLGDGNCL